MKSTIPQQGKRSLADRDLTWMMQNAALTH